MFCTTRSPTSKGLHLRKLGPDVEEGLKFPLVQKKKCVIFFVSGQLQWLVLQNDKLSKVVPFPKFSHISENNIARCGYMKLFAQK